VRHDHVDLAAVLGHTTPPAFLEAESCLITQNRYLTLGANVRSGCSAPVAMQQPGSRDEIRHVDGGAADRVDQAWALVDVAMDCHP